MIKIIFLALLLVGFSSCVPAQAFSKDVGKVSDIQVEVGKVTEIIFPDKVAKVVKGGSQDSVLVEVLDNSVYLLPKTDNLSDIFVTTITGNSYPLNFHVGSHHDIKVQVENARHQESGAFAEAGSYSSVMDLMKDLLLDREPSGATVLPTKSQFLLSDKKLQLKVERNYELAGWRAYVLTAKNLMNNAVIIPLEQISLPNLLAISSDRDMLAARGQEGDTTKVYLITGQ